LFLDHRYDVRHLLDDVDSFEPLLSRSEADEADELEKDLDEERYRDAASDEDLVSTKSEQSYTGGNSRP
jgi:hypothetical protein